MRNALAEMDRKEFGYLRSLRRIRRVRQRRSPTSMTAEEVMEHLRTAWRSEAGEKVLRQAIDKLARQGEGDCPNHLPDL